MFGIGLEEIFVILIIFLLFINPKHWNRIAKKIGFLFGKYQREINKLKNQIDKISDSKE